MLRAGICAACGAPFTTSQPKQVYCTRECGRQHRVRPPWAEQVLRHSQERRRCAWCGRSFDYHPKQRTRFCNGSCRNAARGPRPHCRLVRWRCIDCGISGLTRYQRKRCPACAWLHIHAKSIECKNCGQAIVSTIRYPKHWCSPHCEAKWRRERAHALAQVRRARQHAGFIERIYRHKVFERDRYRCGICGRKTDRRAQVPEPSAPTLDHIVPLKLGGEHSYANVQCAHFICNSRKGASGQLSLRLVA